MVFNLVVDGGSNEKFVLPTPLPKYAAMLKFIEKIIPNIVECDDYSLYYEDNEGDQITINCDGDLAVIEAGVTIHLSSDKLKKKFAMLQSHMVVIESKELNQNQSNIIVIDSPREIKHKPKTEDKEPGIIVIESPTF